MTDELLRTLERRWHETGEPEDEAAYRRVRARTRPTSTDALRGSLEAYDPEAVREAARAFLGPRLAALGQAELDPKALSRWTGEVLGELRGALQPLLGAWARTGFQVGDWCGCHSWVGYGQHPRDVDPAQAASSFCRQLDRVHAFHVSMLALFERLSFTRRDPAALLGELRGAVTEIVALVVDELTCHDAWYGQPCSVLGLLLEEKELAVAPELLGALDEVFSGTFRSWIAPSEAEVAQVADQVAVALVKARFEERYGAE